jgi:hypothetical protein
MYIYGDPETRNIIVRFRIAVLSRIGSATPATCKNNPLLHPSLAPEAVRLGKLMKCNSCFNFKLYKCIGVLD